MTTNLRILCMLFSIFVILLILFLMKKNKITVKYSLIWIVCFLCFFLLAIFPGLLAKVTTSLGFAVSSNMVFAVLIAILILINIMLTVIVTTLNKKLKNIIQEISIINQQK